jgi:hypothetical protein
MTTMTKRPILSDSGNVRSGKVLEELLELLGRPERFGGGSAPPEPLSLGSSLSFAAGEMGCRLVSWRRIGPDGATAVFETRDGYRQITVTTRCEGARDDIDDDIYVEMVKSLARFVDPSLSID